MPTWGEILTEVQASAATRGQLGPDYDTIRRRYLTRLHEYTHRDTIIYSTNWLRGTNPATAVTLEDMQGMMEVCHGLQGPALDLILHSPGGSAEATASIVRYLRRKFMTFASTFPWPRCQRQRCGRSLATSSSWENTRNLGPSIPRST